jgi:lambda repressor-like predicted transcriptional regulator
MDKIIKKLLIDRGLTIADLARKSGYTRAHFSAAIHGRVNSPKVQRAIATALGVEFERFWSPVTLSETSQSDRAGS